MLSIMRWRVVISLLVIGEILALPVAGYAQEAVVSGTVTDSTGAVLPGVTVTALHEASGNTFEGVTDERGAFRLPVRVGVYRLTLQLTGFTTVTRSGLELLVGQQAAVNVQLVPSGVQESVTVTGEAPLVDTSTSTRSGNVDPRQMQELPVNGRNWMDLALLAPGSRRNEGGIPDNRQGYSQVNVDGQQVTTLIASTGDDQPKYSRDAIAEFELITNRFDATQGRSAGLQVNAITKSGTNTFSGLFSGYFRDDRFNAADLIEHRVLPYSNQQLSGTFGGPIRKDKIHFFGNYEYEREPKTVTYSSPFPSFNVDQPNTRREHKEGARLDVQFTSQTRLAVRGAHYYQVNFDGGGAVLHPAGAHQFERYSSELLGTLTQVFGNQTVNEIRGGFAFWDSIRESMVKWKGNCYPNQPVACAGFPNIFLRGYSIQSPGNVHSLQDLYSIRDDYTRTSTKGGRHVMKLGGEYIYNFTQFQWCAFCMPTIYAQNAPIPANIEALIPVWNDASTWNLAPLSPIVTRARQSVSSTEFRYTIPQQMAAGWAQDDWTISPRLTLNLGLRWDMQAGVNSEKVKLLPWLPGDLPYHKRSFGPRLGFALSVTDKTVLRGGYGRFYTQTITDGAHQTAQYQILILADVPNDGRPDFAANIYNGPVPNYEALLANLCDINFRPGCLRRDLAFEINHPWREHPYSQQASIGVQRQLGRMMSVEADYVYSGGRREESDSNMNLSYNPATGANYPFSDISKRPFPDWGTVYGEFLEGWSNSHGLEMAFTKRFSQRWQASATYTLSALWDAHALPYQYGLGANGVVTRTKIDFPLAPDLGGEYTLAATDQRHRAVFNGIWDVAYGVQLSGVYFYGSGKRFSTTYGGDVRNIGESNGGASGTPNTPRLRPDGTIVPRNSLVGKPLHRVDLRIQRRFQLTRAASVDGLLEAFNLFNHENYGSYATQESNRSYGQPSFNSNIAYQPRMLQLGFRFAF
jgi:Carboxypeptidase regulatory-like domain/TonB dependent receptor-like, beta-barrel